MIQEKIVHPVDGDTIRGRNASLQETLWYWTESKISLALSRCSVSVRPLSRTKIQQGFWSSQNCDTGRVVLKNSAIVALKVWRVHQHRRKSVSQGTCEPKAKRLVDSNKLQYPFLTIGRKKKHKQHDHILRCGLMQRIKKKQDKLTLRIILTLHAHKHILRLLFYSGASTLILMTAVVGGDDTRSTKFVYA